MEMAGGTAFGQGGAATEDTCGEQVVSHNARPRGRRRSGWGFVTHTNFFPRVLRTSQTHWIVSQTHCTTDTRHLNHPVASEVRLFLTSLSGTPLRLASCLLAVVMYTRPARRGRALA